MPTPLAKFLPRILPYAPGCSETLAERTLIDAADDFCVQTKILDEALAPLTLVPGIEDYELELEANSERVGEILEVWLVQGARRAELKPLMPRQAREPRREAKPTYFQQVEQADGSVWLRLHPAPRDGGLVEVRVSRRPKDDAQQLADALFRDWREALVAGALARLVALPNYPFSDASRTALFVPVFAAGVAKAQAQAEIGKARATLRTTPCP